MSVDVVEGLVVQDSQPRVNLSEALSRVPGVLIQNRQNYAQDLQVSVSREKNSSTGLSLTVIKPLPGLIKTLATALLRRPVP